MEVVSPGRQFNEIVCLHRDGRLSGNLLIDWLSCLTGRRVAGGADSLNRDVVLRDVVS